MVETDPNSYFLLHVHFLQVCMCKHMMCILCSCPFRSRIWAIQKESHRKERVNWGKKAHDRKYGQNSNFLLHIHLLQVNMHVVYCVKLTSWISNMSYTKESNRKDRVNWGKKAHGDKTQTVSKFLLHCISSSPSNEYACCVLCEADHLDLGYELYKRVKQKR